MDYSQLLREFRKFQLDGYGSSQNTESLNAIMRENKMIFLTPSGIETLQRITQLLYNNFKRISTITEKQIEKYFLDDFFSQLLKKNKTDEEIISSFKIFTTNINELLKKKFTLAIPVSGLKVKSDFVLLNYKIISKAKFKKQYGEKFISSDAKKELVNLTQKGEAIAIVEDYGDRVSVKEKHITELDEALDLVRLYIPFFWHHNYQVQITINNKKQLQDNSCYIFENNELTYVTKSVTHRQHTLEIDEKRTHESKYTIRTQLNRLMFKRMNSIILENNSISSILTSSLKWVGLYTKESNRSVKFIYLMFALETLFTKDQNNYSSITATVSEKAAFLINNKDTNKKDLFLSIKKFYIKRSSIVHGSSAIISDSDLLGLYSIVINVYYWLVKTIDKHNLKTVEQLNEFFLTLKFSS